MREANPAIRSSQLRAKALEHRIKPLGTLDDPFIAAENKAMSAVSYSETTEREISVFATQAFYKAFYNQKALELSENLKKLIEGTIESTKARYKTGESEHHDWLLAKIELNVIDVEGLKLLRDQKTLVSILNGLTDRPTVNPIDSLQVNFSEEDTKDEMPAILNLPELKSISFFLSQAQKEWNALLCFCLH